MSQFRYGGVLVTLLQILTLIDTGIHTALSFTLNMGLLKVGTPKTWKDSKPKLSYIRKAGVKQFISTYNRVKDLKGDELFWGDEIEYGIFILDSEHKRIRLSLRAREVMDMLNEKEDQHLHRQEGCKWVPEYGAWMVEATPMRPYSGFVTDLLRVERSMRLRRKRIMSVLDDNEIAPTVTVFPLLGTLGDDGSIPKTSVGGEKTQSAYIGDGIINPHPRFGTLSANIRQRRGEKVCIRVPLYRDKNTPEYKNLQTSANSHGCCGSDALQLWRYGQGEESRLKYGNDYVVVGCASNESAGIESSATLCKWLVDVKCEGCMGLFYRSKPDVIVADADWPRNGDIVVGSEIPDIPGWIRLQNGYYLPIKSDDGKISFLQKADSKLHSSTEEKRRLGSTTPLFHRSSIDPNSADKVNSELSSILEDSLAGLSLTKDNQQDNKNNDTVINQFDNDTNNLQRVQPAIHMDAMAFGMGCCCLQVTFQSEDIEESKFMYDQLAVLAPIMMALTAATPFHKGRIADTDTRWGIISESVDDRTPAERGDNKNINKDTDLAGNGKRRIYKSRYDSISTYIYQGDAQETKNLTAVNGFMKNRILNVYNDIPVPIDEESYELLRKYGIDPALSQHIAHLFIRDPLVIFDGAVEEVDDEKMTEHFESIQSTNWQTVRWKPPPPRNSPNDPHIGWRVEFRSLEVQLTDFENSAFIVFTVLLTRVIIAFDLNLYIPMSRVDANMQRAHSRNASAQAKFFFRRHLAPLEEGDDGYGVTYTSMFSRVGSLGEDTLNGFENTKNNNNNNQGQDEVSYTRRQSPWASGSAEENSYEEMTMEEIMTGKGNYFPGLIPLVYAYLDNINCDTITFERLSKYLDFIHKRVTGELVTPATWMRNFVKNHKSYNYDSVVTEEIGYDLMVACKQIGEGTLHAPELLGDMKIKEITTENAYDIKLDSRRAHNSQILDLLQTYRHRKPFKS